MYHKDHFTPHFHMKYAGTRASFSIHDLQMIDGGVPRRAVSSVLEWAFQHRDELAMNWERALTNGAARAYRAAGVRELSMRYLIEAEYLDGYRLRVRFDDETVKVVDLGPHLSGAVCEPLKDVAYFRRFRLDPDLDNIVWDNGADFAPEFLYEIGEDERTTAADGPPLRSGP